MNLRFLKEHFLSALQKGVEQNISRYIETEPWLRSHGLATTGVGTTGIDVDRLRPLELPEGSKGEALKDFENTKRVFSDLKCLTATQAQDHRLWVHLSHVEYWKYMQERWPPESVSVIKSRYFFEGFTKDALIHNGISRLWWFGYLTYDPDRADPFELTKILVMNQDIQTSFLERAYGRNRMILHSILEFIRDNREKFKSSDGMSKNVQKISVIINLSGGVALLDCMSKKEIDKVIANAADALFS